MSVPRSDLRFQSNCHRIIMSNTAAYLQTGCFVLANMLMQPRSLPIRKRPPILPLLWAFCHEPETWLICGGCALTLIGMFIPRKYSVFIHANSSKFIRHCHPVSVFYFQVFVEDHDGPPWLINYGVSIVMSLGGEVLN